MKKDLLTLGQRVRVRRREMGIRNQGEFADQLGISQSYVSQIEQDQAFRTADLLARIADVLEVSVDWLLGRELTERPAEEGLSFPADPLRDALLAEYDAMDELGQQSLHAVAVTLRKATQRS